MTLRDAAAFALIALLLPAAAAAQTTSQTETADTSEDVKVYDFNKSETLEGKLVTPTESLVRAENRDGASKLDFTRDNFVPELMKSVEDL